MPDRGLRLDQLGETRLLERITRKLRGSHPDLLVAPGEDDAAAWRVAAGIQVATCDAFVEGLHFRLDRMSGVDVGWRALALTVSDLAAKGAVPGYGLVTAALPRHWTEEQAVGLSEGLAALAEAVGLVVAGGDLTSIDGPATISCFAVGTASGVVLPRSAARPGWLLAVTGRLGAVAAGGAAVLEAKPGSPEHVRAFLRPVPRLGEGRRLARAGIACGDISDGLVAELDKFATMSGCGSRVWLDRVPVAAGVDPAQAWAGGEEVELICAGPAAAIQSVAEELECGLTVIGEVTEDPSVRLLDASGVEIQVVERGYRHFG